MRGKLPAGAGPSPARPDRYKKGSFVRLHPEKWAELAPRLEPELRATYWSLLSLAPAGEFNERGAGKVANLLGVKPTRALELINQLAAFQFAGGPLCFVEQRADRLVVRLAINNGLLVLHGSAATTPLAPTESAPRRLPPSSDFQTLISAARRALAASAGEGVLELADALVNALAEQEPDGQLPGRRQMAIFSFLTTKHSAGNGHVGDALRDMLNRPELPTDVLSYLEASITSRVERSGHRRADPVATAPIELPGADIAPEPADEPEVRRTADGRRIADDFNPDDMF